MKAVENYGQAIRLDPLFFPAKNNLAMLYNAADENEKAEKLFTQILAKNPQMYDITYSLGLLLVEEKRYDEALVYLQKAAAGLPGRASVRHNLGLLLQYLKRDKAAENLNREG